MADRFPTLEDVPVPNAGGARPVAGYDVSPFARGAQALAQGVQNLGQGIEKGAQTIQEYEMAKMRNDALLAQDQIIGDVYKAREDFKHDTGYEDLTDRWDKRVGDIVQKGIQSIPEGSLAREHVIARLQIPLARTRDSIEDYAFNGRSQQAHAALEDRYKTIVERTGADEDPLVDAPGGQRDQFNSLADDLAQRKLLTPLQAQQYKRKLALDRADARARARLDRAVENNDQGEIQKLLGELRNSIPRSGAGAAAPGATSIFPPGGWGPTDHAASVTSKAETGDATLGVKALGNISPDKSGSKSYGFMGLNSGTGSANAFALQYGRQFGLTARPGSVAFDQQWKEAAANHTDEFRQAQLAWFNERVVPTVTGDLTGRGIPANIANDPRVLTYFADRKIQMGIAGIDAVRQAWAGSGGDTVAFLRNMNDLDRENIEKNFKTTLAERIYSPEGHETRLRTRLNGALAAGTAGAAPPPSEADEEPPTGYTGDPLFSRLTAPHRDSLIAKAMSALRQGRVQAGQQLKAAINDDYTAARTTGYVSNARTLDEFTSALGEEAGRAEFEQYNRGLQLNRDLYAMQTMEPEERQQLIDWHASNLHPEAPGYTERFKEFKPLLDLSNKLSEAEGKAAVESKKGEIADLDRRMKDDYEQVRRGGTLGNAITREEFIKTLGEQDGDAAFSVYTNSIQHATDLYHLPEQAPEDKIGAARIYEPQPGQANQEAAWARVGQLRQAADHLHKELQDNPANYMLRYNPAVKDAWMKMQNAQPGDEAQASQAYASVMKAEQERFGVEPQSVKIVPDQYADNFKTKVEQLAQAGNSNQIGPLLKAESDKWGPAWPQVYKQVTAGNPMLTVVGAGVKSSAGQLLVNNEKIKFGDIVKDEQSAKAKDVRDGVDTEMASFAKSLIGNAGGIAVYNTFRGQIEKLAAIYAFQNGMDAATAAKRATDDVLNFKYDYRDGYRIPAKEHSDPAPVSPDDIQVGAGYARQYLGRKVAGIDLALNPAIDTFGGAYTPAQLASETADAKRNGRWTTNSDETGLAYTYNGQVVRRPDGSPLVLTWQQLGQLAKRSANEAQEIERQVRSTGVGPL